MIDRKIHHWWRGRASLLAVALTLTAFLLSSGSAQAQELKTRNVVLIMLDGLRWQELFTGAEKELISKKPGGVSNVEALEKKFWRETPEERREALMPFFWNTIARQGQIFGNLNEGSSAQITNTMKFSYPGYNEILTGFADPKITSNAKKPNENFTVLEWLHRKPAYDGKVAAFAMWDVVSAIINRQRCDFPVMAGWERVPDPDPNPRQQLLNDLIADSTRHIPSELHDSFLYYAAREHLLRHQPRVFYVSFGETDGWGHQGRYDHLLNSAHTTDDWIRRLWELMQSMDQYRDQTTFIITTDHGRGSGPENWKHHGEKIEGAEQIWVAVLGPDTPALGERKNCELVTQNQIAATLAAFLGEDYCKEVPRAGTPIKDVLPKSK